MAAPYDLAFVQGETFEREFVWSIDGVVQPLAGRGIKSEVRTREDSNSELIVNLALYMTFVGDTIKVRVPATVTSIWDPRKFRRAAWDLFLVETADPTEARCILAGAVTLDPAATRLA